MKERPRQQVWTFEEKLRRRRRKKRANSQHVNTSFYTHTHTTPSCICVPFHSKRRDERRDRKNEWHATEVPSEAVAVTRRMFQQTELVLRPLPPPLDRSQSYNKRINGLRYTGHYALLFIREGVLSLAPPSSGCLERGVNNSGHYWLHNYKMWLLQNVGLVLFSPPWK